MRYPNVTGVTGVARIKTRWGRAFRATASVNYEQIALKESVDFFEAVCARKSAENKVKLGLPVIAATPLHSHECIGLQVSHLIKGDIKCISY